MELSRYDSVRARNVFGELADVYAEIYAAMLAEPFRSVPRFLRRLEEYASQPGFDLVTARKGDDVLGYALGYSLAPDTRWWADVEPPLPADFTQETTEGRTFVLEELMVRERWRGQGVARALYDVIIEGRHEERATMLARPGNEQAQAIAAHWGWRKVGTQRPTPDAPLFDTFVLDLR